MGLVGPEHPSVAENRLGVDRIASEGASDDHIIGAISFRRLHFLLRPFVSTFTNHVYICCNYLFARQFILDISPAVSVLYVLVLHMYSGVSFRNPSVPCPCMNSHTAHMHEVI